MENRTYGDADLEGLFARLYGILRGEPESAGAFMRSTAAVGAGGEGDLFAPASGEGAPRGSGASESGQTPGAEAAAGGAEAVVREPAALASERTATSRAAGRTPASQAAESISAQVTARAAAAERILARYSPWARLDFLYAWMSELPIEREMLAFAAQVVDAGREAERGGARGEAVRAAAETARTDRGERAVRVTLAAVQKVTREEHRLIGLLRFTECADGRLVARCACDHAVLPALADHFSARFGARRWAIVDERRGWALVADPPRPPRLMSASASGLGLVGAGDAGAMGSAVESAGGDEWEDLWRGYHRAVAIDSRKNPALQRRLMPVRYWKYLTELR